MKRIYSLFLFIVFLGFFSCHHSGIKIPDSSFNRYISAFTYGVISIRSTFEIELQDNYKGNEKVGEEIKTTLFEFSPSIEGRTILKSTNKIEFIPNKPLESDKNYTVQFHLKDAIREVDEQHGEFEYSIQTIQAGSRFQNDGFVINPSAQKSFDFKGKIVTSDFVDDKVVEENMDINLDNKVLWSHTKNGTEHSFTVKNIVAKNASQTLKIDVDLDHFSTPQEELDIYIPSKDEFIVTSVYLDKNDKNKTTITFSENVATSGNEGMFYINHQTNYTMLIQGNKVILSPNDESLFGDVSIKAIAGIQSTNGKKLAQTYEHVVSFSSSKPNAEIIGDGNILVNNDGAMLPIKTVGLNQVKVDIYKIYQSNVLFFLQNNSLQETYDTKRFGKKIYTEILKLNGKAGFSATNAYNYNLDLSQIVNMEKGAIYQVKLSYDQSMAANVCSKETKKSGLFDFSMLASSRFLNSQEDEDSEEESDYDYYYPDGYNYEKKDDPCDVSYYTNDRFPKKNILVSNIGLIAKKGTDNRVYATCVDLLDASPMIGATIEVFNYQFQRVGKGYTGLEGFCEVQAEEKPHFVVATKNGQKNYISLEKGNAQSSDVFDVEGNQTQHGMKCFVYGERGVWRPGDKIFLTMILSNGYHELPKDLPCQMELVNPQGQVFDKQINDKSLNGFYSFMTKTSPDAITGNWTARFKVGGLRHEKIIKIETVKPNRLRIVSENTDEFISNGQTLTYKTSWLNGANSAGLSAKVDVNYFSAPVEFKHLKDYSFNDRTKNFTPFEQSMFNGTTATDGSFQFNFNLESDPSNIPGMLNAVMTTKVFEGTGEFSIQYDTKKVSYFNSYIGHKINNNSQYYLDCDKDYQINIANVDAKGQFVNGKSKAKISLYKVEYNWWYNSYNATNFFDQSNIKQMVYEKEVEIINGKINYPIRIAKSNWGNYLIKVTDLNSNHSSSSFVNFEAPYYENSDASRESSNIIQLTKDKDKYKVGEQAKIKLVSYFKGRALLSIENGNEVLKTEWFDLKQGENTLEFKVEEDMSPNVYAYISAIQPHKNMANNLPIRMYGIIPIAVDNTNSILKPIIKAPAKIEPETKLNFSVSETNNKHMTYTVAIVDEGLLGISGYKTPEPWSFFYGKESLGVLTWDIFDKVINAFTGVFQEVFAIGGDAEAAKQMNKAKSNRFESVVKYIGPFELKGGTNQHSIDIPNYVGNLKVMVIAGGPDYRFGSATADVNVAKPLMVLGTLPRVLSLEEEVELPVNVFVTEKSIQNVTLSIQTDQKVSVIDGNTKSLQFPSPSDQIVNFKLKTKDLQGVTKVKITARSGRHISTYEMDVPIRIPNPTTIDYEQIVLNPHETKTIQVTPIGVTGTSSISLESSTIPDLNLQSKIDELIAYPHGCLEQTTSALFPQLFLGDLTELTKERKDAITANIQTGFEKYKSFQSSQGGLSYWPNSNYVDDYASIYATHFMIEAKNKGYDYNPDLLTKNLDHLNNIANSFNPNNPNYMKSIQAYRLYLLALGGKANLGGMNRLKESPLDASAKIKLALAYGITGKKDVASQMTTNIGSEIMPYIDDRYTYGSDNLDNAFLLELYVRLQNKSAAYTTFRQCISALNSKSYLGTQTTSGMIRAISFYLSKYKVAPVNLSISFLNKTYQMKGTKPTITQSLDPRSGTLTITNNSNAISVVNLVRKGTELNVKENISPLLSVTVEYISKDGKSIDKSNIARQTDFKQIIKIKNNALQEFNNIALSNFTPSGWEIINNRIASSEVSNTKLDYQDIRDDRILSYFSIQPGETKIIVQDFNASYEGKYTMPAIVVESMYQPSVKTVLGSYKTQVSR